MSLLNILTVWIRESSAFALSEYNLRSTMNTRWFIVSPDRNSYPGLVVLIMCVRGMRAITSNNGDSTSPRKILLFLGISLSVPSSRTLPFFPKLLPQFLLCPSYLSSLSPRSGGPCHKLCNNPSVPSLSSSFVSLPAEASYLCITDSPVPFHFLLHPVCSSGNIFVL